jgi:hypothetical protein
MYPFTFYFFSKQFFSRLLLALLQPLLRASHVRQEIKQHAKVWVENGLKETGQSAVLVVNYFL